MAIPKVVHFLWMSETKDERTENCLASWREHLGGYEIREWNGSSFPYQDFVWTREATQAKSWAYVTDYFRLWVLYNYGGIYLDADMMLQGNFDGYLECPFFVATEHTRQLGPHCMGSEPGHAFLRECLDFYEGRHFVSPDGSLQIILIPWIMTYILMKRYRFNGTLANFSDTPIVLGDELYIYPDNIFTIDIGDGKNVGIHLGLGSWRTGCWVKKSRWVYERSLHNYFVNRYYLGSPQSSCKFRLFVRNLLPRFVLVAWRRWRLKVGNVKVITSIRDCIL